MRMMKYAGLVLVSLFFLVGAAAVSVPAWRAWAGSGVVALTVCVIPANISVLAES